MLGVGCKETTYIRHGEHGRVMRFLAHHDVRVWEIFGRTLFNVRVSHLNVEEASLETTGPKKRTQLENP